MSAVSDDGDFGVGRVIARAGNDVRVHVPAVAALDPCPDCTVAAAAPAFPTRLRASRGGGARWTFLTRECRQHDIGELTATGTGWSLSLRVDGPPWDALFVEVHTEIGGLEISADVLPSWLQRALPVLRDLHPTSDPQQDEDTVRWALLGLTLEQGRAVEALGVGAAQVWHLRNTLTPYGADRIPVDPARRAALEEALRDGGRPRPRAASRAWLPLDREVAWIREMQDDPGLDEHMVAGWIRSGITSPGDRPPGLDPRDVMVLVMAQVPVEDRWAGFAYRLCPDMVAATVVAGREPAEAVALAEAASGLSLDFDEHLTVLLENWQCGWAREDASAITHLMREAADVNWVDLATCLRAQMGQQASLVYLRAGRDMGPVRLLAGLTE